MSHKIKKALKKVLKNYKIEIENSINNYLNLPAKEFNQMLSEQMIIEEKIALNNVGR